MKDIVDKHYQVYKETRRGLQVFAKLLLPEEVEVEVEVDVEVEEDTTERERRPLLE